MKFAPLLFLAIAYANLNVAVKGRTIGRAGSRLALAQRRSNGAVNTEGYGAFHLIYTAELNSPEEYKVRVAPKTMKPQQGKKTPSEAASGVSAIRKIIEAILAPFTCSTRELATDMLNAP